MTTAMESARLARHRPIEEATAAYHRERNQRMGIVEVKELPKRKRSERKSKYPFTDGEISSAVKQYKSAGRVGCGPYDGGLRAGRSAAQRLKALVCAAGDIDPDTVSTTAWEDDKGAWGALKVKTSSAE